MNPVMIRICAILAPCVCAFIVDMMRKRKGAQQEAMLAQQYHEIRTDERERERRTDHQERERRTDHQEREIRTDERQRERRTDERERERMANQAREDKWREALEEERWARMKSEKKREKEAQYLKQVIHRGMRLFFHLMSRQQQRQRTSFGCGKRGCSCCAQQAFESQTYAKLLDIDDDDDEEVMRIFTSSLLQLEGNPDQLLNAFASVDNANYAKLLGSPDDGQELSGEFEENIFNAVMTTINASSMVNSISKVSRSKKKGNSGGSGSVSGSGNAVGDASGSPHHRTHHVSNTDTTTSDEESYDGEEEQPQIQTPSQEQISYSHDGFPIMEPGGCWFHSPPIVKLVGETITCNYREFAPSWRHVSPRMRDDLWNFFQQRVRLAPSLYDLMRKDWELSIAKRLRDLIYRATTPKPNGKSKSCPIWIPEDIYEQLLARRRQKGFKEKSKKFQQNRCSGGKDEKAPGTHTMGRRNAIRILDDMYEDNEKVEKIRLSRAPDLFRRSKSIKEVKGKGKQPATENNATDDDDVVFLSQKDFEINSEYNRRVAEQARTDEEYDYNQIYFDVVKGYDKKGRVYDVGSAGQRFYERKTIGKNPDRYEPGALAKEKARNEELSQRLEAMEKWKQEMEEQMRNFNCRNMFTHPHMPRRGDDGDDDGGGGGGGNDGLASGFFSNPTSFPIMP